MGKHTEGPWHVGMKPGPMIYGPHGEQIADLTAQFVPDSETIGNALLMAAAPDLLAALEALLAVPTLERYITEHSAMYASEGELRRMYEEEARRIEQDASDAIAKAMGQA